MFGWIEDYMKRFDCDYETAAREYYAIHHPESYESEDYDEY